MLLQNPINMQLEIKNLSKTYPNGTKALDQVNLSISEGMFGLLGPNGAGKSTLMRTLATLQEPDQGSIYLDGLEVLAQPMALRKVLGYLPQSFGVYPNMSAEKLLSYFAKLKGLASKAERVKMVDYVLELTNLTEYRKRNVSAFSGGMRQRFGIAQLLLNDPKLIIVDEPTAGLDPAERHRFLNILRSLGQDRIVLFSTHIVEDVKDLCQDMAILNRGTILLKETPKAAVATLAGKVWKKPIEETAFSQYENQYNIISSGFGSNNKLHIRVLQDHAPDNEFEAAEVALDDVYFSMLNQQAA